MTPTHWETLSIPSCAHLLPGQEFLSLGRVEPPRIIVGRIIESIGDFGSKSGHLAGGSHQLKYVWWRRCKQRIGPLHDPVRVIPERIKSLLHPGGIKGLLAPFENSFQVHTGRLACCVGALSGYRIV